MKLLSSSAEDAASTTILPLIPETHPNEYRSRRRIIQNFFLIWVDSSFDKPTVDYEDIFTQLESIFSIVYTYTNIDSCVNFLKKIVNKNVFVIVSSCLSEQLVPIIHNLSQLEVIYILGGETIPPEDWPKVKGVHSHPASICKALKQDVKQCNQNNISVSFVPSNDGTTNPNLDQLDPSFMYTQIFKEILLKDTYDRKSIEDFVTYCRQQNLENRSALNIIAEFEREYYNQVSILWYTRHDFIYDVLNQALRNLEADTIIKMGFFINDLHNCIEKLHSEQKTSRGIEPFTVYRGQGLFELDFGRLLKSNGGLISFNCFLSTSTNRSVSMMYAESNSGSRNKVGILFKITIDPLISSSPYAYIEKFSHFSEEGEVLFSMHAVFRIIKIKQLHDYTRIWQVNLKLTSDKDQQLNTLTKQIRQETSGSTGYEQLGKLLFAIGQFEKAEELYLLLFDQTLDMTKKSIFCQKIGDIKDKRDDYEDAISFYKKAIEIKENIYPVNNLELGKAYILIGAMYMKIKDFPTAKLMRDKGIEILCKTSPSSHPDLVISYIDSGRASHQTSEHFEAPLSEEAMLEISETGVPTNHPHLAASYNNIGVVYHNMGDSSKALSFYEKALEIFQKTLPSNHPSLATSYNNIAAVYKNVGEYSKALSYHEKSLEIRHKTRPANHPDLAISYINISMLYQVMGEYSKALSYQEKSLEIQQKTLPANHPDLAISYTNCGIIYQSMGEYSKALSYHEKSIEIRQKTLPSDRPDLANSYNNMGMVYQSIGIL
jgi:tetratricopeptide (TPR) repeat protein